jgi:hypothetical protein
MVPLELPRRRPGTAADDGVAVALLVDATIVRSVLVPASMKLLGERNWYLPSWLNWVPDVHVEGHTPAGKPPEKPAPLTTA